MTPMLGLGRTLLKSKGFKASWTPTALSPALWLDANDASTITLNGTTVSQWRDKSGNARHASQDTAANQPTYSTTGLNGRPTLRFNNPTEGRYLLSSANFPSMTSGVSAIVVAQIDTVANYNGYVGVGEMVANTSNFEFYRQVNDDIGSPNSGNLVVIANRGSSTSSKFRNNLNTSPVAGAPHIVTTVISASNNALMSINGEENLATGGEVPGGTFIPQGTGIIRVGIGFLDANTTLSVMRGRISEIVMSASPWSTTNRQRLEGYLAWKWGLVANLPSNHPYKNSPPTV